ncbi:DUF1992 domain-containing protein [Krasilnikovia sp. M28-CT-15]|uniref:DnaJ family domain-containing protein n=1 Tax=Krasilnikovia sp. M28-CT-15 TaxID=3373540 RepID=UPI003875FA34
MAHGYESAVDRLIRQAQEQGEFDNLRGTGKPLSDHGREYDEDWWIKDWLAREGAGSGVLPSTLALRREVEDLPAAVDRLHTEEAVRGLVADVNERIRKARAGLLDGPAVLLPPCDPDEAVRGWRERRSA